MQGVKEDLCLHGSPWHHKNERTLTLTGLHSHKYNYLAFDKQILNPHAT